MGVLCSARLLTERRHARKGDAGMGREKIPDTVELCGDFINYIEQNRRFAAATVRTYSYVLNTFIELFKDMRIQNVTLEQIDHYIVLFGNERNLKAASLNTVRCVLRSFFMYCDRYRGIRLRFDYSMIRQVKAPRARIKYVTLDEARLIIRNLKTPQDKLMYALTFAAGLRISELVNLQVEDFRGTEFSVRGKGAVDRTIPIDDNMSRAIRLHIVRGNLRTGPLFRHQMDKNNLKSDTYTTNGLRKRWQRQLKPLGIYKKPHAARHGIATELLYQGMDLRTLQTFLGHSNIATTQIYTHITDSRLRESVNRHFPSDKFNAVELINED